MYDDIKLYIDQKNMLMRGNINTFDTDKRKEYFLNVPYSSLLEIKGFF